MKLKTILTLLVFVIPTVAFAQQPLQPQFEPYTVTVQEHQAFLNYLGDVPSRYANPLILQLTQMEQAAQQKKIALPTPEGAKPK